MVRYGSNMIVIIVMIVMIPLFSFAQSSITGENHLEPGERGKQEGVGWKYCGMVERYGLAPSNSMDPANNKREKSLSLAGSIKKLKDQQLYAMQHSYRWNGERVQCMDYLWFNNRAFSKGYRDKITLNPKPQNHVGGRDYDRNNALRTEHVNKLKGQGIDVSTLAQGKNLFIANGDGKTEKECYEKFVNYARDDKNYQVENNPNMQQGLQIFEALKTTQDPYGIPVLPPKLTIQEFLNGNGSGFTGFKQIITNDQVRDFSETEVWYLQTAINILGCDHIRMDGMLGNYTIKSFCRCAFPPQGCIELEEKTFGKIQAKNLSDLSGPLDIIPHLRPINFSVICSDYECLGTNDPTKREIQCTTKVELTMKNIIHSPGSQVEFCCPRGTKSHMYPDLKKYPNASLPPRLTCCIDPNVDLGKCVEESELLAAKEISCSLKNPSPKECTLKSTVGTGGNFDEATKVPFCPCPNGGNWVYKEGSGGGPGSWDCPCIPYDPETLKKRCTNRGDNKCGPDGECVEEDGNIVPICPCPKGKQPVPGPDGKPICTCTDPTIEGFDGQCRPCPSGLVPSKDKKRCECENGCCGIKLNTNVPWIGRCIEFGNTNNLDDQWLNEYGDGNTIITVNILNAFPVLMTALGKILLTIIFVFGFGLIIYAGMRWTTDGLDSGAASEASNIIKKVVIGFAFLGASAIILHFINPNFFK